jgi:hypothetical protein
VNLYTGCVVTHADRKWILWDKKGTTVRLVEPLDVYGPNLEVRTVIDECKFVAENPKYRKSW